jgi:hypothetical protein
VARGSPQAGAHPAPYGGSHARRRAGRADPLHHRRHRPLRRRRARRAALGAGFRDDQAEPGRHRAAPERRSKRIRRSGAQRSRSTCRGAGKSRSR